MGRERGRLSQTVNVEAVLDTVKPASYPIDLSIN